MCGIVGVWGECDEETVRAMMRRLVHRGPAAQGISRDPQRPAALGHHRLAIMDPAGGIWESFALLTVLLRGDSRRTYCKVRFA